MGAFETIVQSMAGMDLFQLFFPWLLILAVTYGILEKHNVFSDDAQVNGVIALSLAFFSVGGAYYFLPQGILSSLAAGLTFSVFGLLGFMILLAVAGFDLSGDFGLEDPLPIIAVVLGLLSFLGAFFFQADLDALVGGVENVFQEMVMPILVLIFLLLVIGAVADS